MKRRLNVVPIGAAREANHRAIAQGLKALRKDAKRGRIRAIAMVVAHEDGEVVYGTLGEGGWAALLAGTTCLQAALVAGEPSDVHPGRA